jgi:hypothetical protein
LGHRGVTDREPVTSVTSLDRHDCAP